jgi:uncharacterized GH25 family protein
VAAVCQYGVLQRDKSEPFLLNYYAKGFVGMHPALSPKELPGWFTQPWDKLPLEIVPLVGEGRLAVRVVWQGKPLAGAEYALLVPGEAKPTEGKTDADGKIKLAEPLPTGPYGIRVKHTEAKEGQLAGKAYKEVRHYATLTLTLSAE